MMADLAKPASKSPAIWLIIAVCILVAATLVADIWRLGQTKDYTLPMLPQSSNPQQPPKSSVAKNAQESQPAKKAQPSFSASSNQ